MGCESSVVLDPSLRHLPPLSAVVRLYFSAPAGKPSQLSFRNSKFCETAVHADEKLREYEDAGLFRPSHPPKCTLISALNFPLLAEVHDLHVIASLLWRVVAYGVPKVAMT
jgi:hypothetical protein